MQRSLAVLSFAGLATASIACGSSSTTSNPDGSGAGGAGISCPATPFAADDNTVSDFEDGRGAVLQVGNPPRNGGWYAYNDQGTTCSETPAMNRCATEAPPSAEIVGGRCGSTHAFRFNGTGCTSYAGVGTDLAAPLPPDPDAGPVPPSGCDDGGVPAVVRKTPYDMTSFKAITFWGRMGDTAVPKGGLIQFKVPMLADTKVADGGDCNLSETGQDKCSASYGKFLQFTQAWKQFTVNLDPMDKTNGISQETWGKMFMWDPTIVTSIQFQAAASTTFDVWIDDIELISK